MVARPHKRRRDGEGEDAGTDDDDTVDLDAAEHAWWAQRPTEQAWTPRSQPPPDDQPRRDILAEHFGADWRTSFGFEPLPAGAAPPEPERGSEREEVDPEPPAVDDPYGVLGVPEAATWDQIVTAHRALAMAHHPDVVAERPDAERAAAEDRIREVNIAYQALRVRRGR